MATPNKNAKSQLTTVRVPHDVMDGMEAVKMEGESNAGFIITAMQGEITRRQLKEDDESRLLSNLSGALASLAQIEEIGTKAGEKIRQLVSIASEEIQRRKANTGTPEE
ncbi:YlcI/YnfO family protein [Yersinia enterocolitica]